MNKYETIISLEGFKIAVKNTAPDSKTARSQAITTIMSQLALIINNSEEFELDAFTIGKMGITRKID